MFSYKKLKGSIIPPNCHIENGLVLSQEPLNLSDLYLFDLEPMDKSFLNDVDRLALSAWYEGSDVDKWWVEPSYEERLLNKPEDEIRMDLYGDFNE